MSYRFRKITGEFLGPGTAQSADEVTYLGTYEFDEDGIDIGLVWDESIQNMRLRNDSEKLTVAKTKKKKELRGKATEEAAKIYDFITSPDYYFFAEDLYLSTIVAARAPLSGRLLAFKNVKDTYDVKRAEINALTTITEVQAYDVTAGW